MFGIDIDDQQVTAKLKQLMASEDAIMSAGENAAAFELLRLSQFEVPHDEGSLQNSGVVEEDGNDIVVGYRQRYAARLHENPQYKFQKGRKGKYLEDPINNNKEVLNRKFGLEVEGEFRRIVG